MHRWPLIILSRPITATLNFPRPLGSIPPRHLQPLKINLFVRRKGRVCPTRDFHVYMRTAHGGVELVCRCRVKFWKARRAPAQARLHMKYSRWFFFYASKGQPRSPSGKVHRFTFSRGASVLGWWPKSDGGSLVSDWPIVFGILCRFRSRKFMLCDYTRMIGLRIRVEGKGW